jgi:HAMP domain-containing protein
MIAKIKQALGYAFGILLLGAYLLFVARKSGKNAAEIERAKDRIDKMKKANDVDKEIDQLDADSKRDRLR